MYPSNLPSRSLGPSSCPFIDIYIKHIKNMVTVQSYISLPEAILSDLFWSD